MPATPVAKPLLPLLLRSEVDTILRSIRPPSLPTKALERTTTNPNPRVTSLLGPASTASGGRGSDHSPPEASPSLGGGGPRTSTVTSISSADPLAVDPVAAAEAAAEAAANNAKGDGERGHRMKRRHRRVGYHPVEEIREERWHHRVDYHPFGRKERRRNDRRSGDVVASVSVDELSSSSIDRAVC